MPKVVLWWEIEQEPRGTSTRGKKKKWGFFIFHTKKGG